MNVTLHPHKSLKNLSFFLTLAAMLWVTELSTLRAAGEFQQIFKPHGG